MSAPADKRSSLKCKSFFRAADACVKSEHEGKIKIMKYMFAQCRICQHSGLFTQTRNTLCAGAGKHGRRRRRLIWKFVSEVTLKLCFSHKLRCKHALRARGRPGPHSRRASEKSFAVASGGAVWASNHTPHKCQSTQMEKEEEKITQNINIELIDKVISLNIHTS